MAYNSIKWTQSKLERTDLNQKDYYSGLQFHMQLYSGFSIIIRFYECYIYYSVVLMFSSRLLFGFIY